MSPTETIIIVVAVLILGAVLIVGWLWWRHRALRARFGPEYERAAAEHDSRLAADRELRAREKRHAELELRELDTQTRHRYARAWQEIQARFVEAPDTAIDAAQDLVVQLAAERGYPTGDDEQIEQLSVDHAGTLGHYREARDIHGRHRRGEASTEDLRQALVHYRALFADLLGEEPAMESNTTSVNSTKYPAATSQEAPDAR